MYYPQLPLSLSLSLSLFVIVFVCHCLCPPLQSKSTTPPCSCCLKTPMLSNLCVNVSRWVYLLILLLLRGLPLESLSLLEVGESAFSSVAIDPPTTPPPPPSQNSPTPLFVQLNIIGPLFLDVFISSLCLLLLLQTLEMHEGPVQLCVSVCAREVGRLWYWADQASTTCVLHNKDKYQRVLLDENDEHSSNSC